MSDYSSPLDADELMSFDARIDALPPDDAEWVGRLFHECLRARMHVADLMEASASAAPRHAASNDSEHEAQLAQVALDVADWLRTMWDVGYTGSGSFPAPPRSEFPRIQVEDVLKSSLFARIREGKRPLPFPPPTRNGLPWHDLVAGSSESYVVEAEIIHDDEGRAIGARIEGGGGWRVVEPSSSEGDFILQHAGKGPLYRLRLTPILSTLQRLAPQWQRHIRFRDRGGIGSFVLLWPRPDGSTNEIALRATTRERAESEADLWIASHCPEMYGQVRFEHVTG